MSCAPVRMERGWQPHPAGSVLIYFGEHPGAVRGERRARGAALAAGKRARLGDGGVRDAAERDQHA